MTTVYLIRHCEAEGNRNNTFQGSMDNGITDRGKRQLEALARRFAHIHLDAIYSSPLLRARETAYALQKGRDLTVQVEPDLREINGGDWEGHTWKEIQQNDPDGFFNWRNRPDRLQCPNGENFYQVSQRVTACVQRLVKAHPGQTIALTSHGMAIKCLLRELLGYPMKDLYDVPVGDNTAVSLLEFQEDGTCRVVYMSDNQHLLEEDLSTLAHVDQWWRTPAERRQIKKLT
ncbi:MAG: histidine phosphatase family protein [Eubacteriales bacterium]|jgi:probable phosphoglycerate mutase